MGEADECIADAIGRLRRTYLLIVEDGIFPRECWKDLAQTDLTLAEGFLLLWHSMRASLDLPNPGLEYLLFCASLLELLLQDYILVDASEDPSWAIGEIQIMRGVEGLVAETINGFTPGVVYEVLHKCTEGQTEYLTHKLLQRGIITEHGVQKSVLDKLRLSLRKTLVNGTPPSPYYSMLAIWCRAADNHGAFLDACLNQQARCSPPVVSRLTKLDELDPQKMTTWWGVDTLHVATDKALIKDEGEIQGHNKSPMYEPSPAHAEPSEENKPCCTIA